ncbi:MAG: hypothetical protein ACOH5I_08885 [Oligoflexus sp.]
MTNPAFMRRFNNFRSRVRALTDALLCREVDGSLNTDGIQHLVNPDISEFDMQIVSRETCASCHLGMDNMGAHIFGWNDQGTYQRWPQELSQIGHAFGVSGNGPEDLMVSYMEHAPGFLECMAKKSWEDFTGQSWSVLMASEMQQLVADAGLGPRYLIQAVLSSPALVREKFGSDDTSGTSSDEAIDFIGQVNPILSASCSGSNCHGSDSVLGSRYQFVDHEAGFRGAPIERLEDGSMPPSSSGFTLGREERELLIRYLQNVQ